MRAALLALAQGTAVGIASFHAPRCSLPRILVVEDNAKLAGHLRRGLAEKLATSSMSQTDGIDGRHYGDGGLRPAVLLDVMLPGADGFIARETQASGGHAGDHVDRR